MNYITELPKNISYYPHPTEKKEQGAPVMVLDLTKTYVNVIPQKLLGVDQVVAKPNQIKYIAPLFQGKLVEAEEVLTSAGTKVAYTEVHRSKMDSLKNQFQLETKGNQRFFDTSYKANRVCSGYPAEEMHLPSGLKFSWNLRVNRGILDAKGTRLEKRTPIKNIYMMKITSQEELEALKKQDRELAQIFRKKRNYFPKKKNSPVKENIRTENPKIRQNKEAAERKGKVDISYLKHLWGKGSKQ